MTFTHLPPHRHFLVTDNLGLAGYVLNRWFKPHLGTRFQDDLESWAYEALCEAAAKYDPGYRVEGRPVKFSTFACKWIWGRTRSYFDAALRRESRLPTHTGQFADDGTPFLDTLTDGRGPEAVVDDADAREHLSAAVDGLLRRLHPREQYVLRAIAGVGEEHGEKVKLETLGERLGVSRERVRQIGERARRKLRGRVNA